MTLGYVNGWNMVNDNNNGKTFEGQLNGNPFSWLNAIVNAYYGPEIAPGTPGTSSGGQRYVVDICATVSYSTWKFGFNYDSGHDDQLAGGAPDSWGGVAGYIRDQIVRWNAVTLRAETFRDSKGAVSSFVGPPAVPIANTGFTIGNDGVTQAGAIKLWEITLTDEIKINDNLLFRIEYRHDQADKRVFQEGNDPQGKKNQDTIGFEAIFMF
jgi:hypothetical protein